MRPGNSGESGGEAAPSVGRLLPTAAFVNNMEVQFQDVYFTVSSPLLSWPKGKSQDILRGVSGCFRAGELSAILGPSGAGKTTLLNAISGYKKTGLRGQLLLDGVPRDERKFRKMSCYITQEDLLVPLLSLDEIMLFASVLKLPPSYSAKQRRSVVNEVQSMLGLSESKNTLTDRLSGGQKKRLSIALELINNPPILFLDEPTSGLDNVTAAHLIRLLSQLAKGGRTIVCTIHQPSASLFGLFDLVYFISAGRCVYQGGPGPHLLDFLNELKFSCPEYHNPADFVIELMEEDKNIEILSKGTNNGKITWFTKGYLPATSQKAAAIGKETTLLQYGRLGREESKSQPCSELLSFWIQFSTLFQRMFLQQKRNKIGLTIQFYHHVGCALALGIMFYKKALDGNEFFNHMKFCMGIILFHTYTQCMAPILSYPFEVKLLKKEHFNQWYKLLPYYMAYTASHAPTIIILNQLYLIIIYSLSGLPWEVSRFFVFSSVGIMTSFVAEGMGLTISSLFSVTNGSAVGPLTLAPCLGFAIYGFDFARTISPFMTAVVRTSFMRAGVVALVLAVFGMDRGPLDCTDPVYCHFSDPKVTLHYLFLEDKSVWDYVLDLFVILCLFRLAFYYGLKWRLRK